MEESQLDSGVLRPGRRRLLPALLVGVLLVAHAPIAAAQESFNIEQSEFELVWERTEAPVANGVAQRSWLWGPEPRTAGMSERYLESPGQERTVQYFDKGRMEVNDPTANPSDPWFVTSGLLTRELISGEIQVGDAAFLKTGEGASIHVAGDHLNPFPQYRHLVDIVDQGHPDRTGQRADAVFTPEGLSTSSEAPDDPKAEFAHYVVYLGPNGVDVGYNIPEAFWDYLNAPGTIYANGASTVANPLFSWLFVMGFPISDPFWAQVPVGGIVQWVLIQPFERRVLTYTPGNDPTWQVEMGNIGQHYRDWRSQFFPEAPSGGDAGFFGLPNSAVWRYDTSMDIQEIWEAIGQSDSFVPGSTLAARDEYRIESLRTTYWSADGDGLFLHGWEQRDADRNIENMVVYSPPLHVLPPERIEGQLLQTNTRAISLNDEPVETMIEFHVRWQQVVVTPAGEFRTWRMESTDFSQPGVRHNIGHTFWFEPHIGVVQWINNQYSANLVGSSVLEN
jgi:hypothetical protein